MNYRLDRAPAYGPICFLMEYLLPNKVMDTEEDVY